MKKRFIDIQGYLEEDEGLILQSLATNRSVMEIGSYYGRSTVCFAEVAKFVFTIDTHRGMSPNDQIQAFDSFTTLDDFRNNIAGYTNIKYAIGTTEQIIPKIRKQFDLIFIDGCHLYDSVRTDILLSLKQMKYNGYMIIHDYFHTYLYPGVSKATNEIFKESDGSFNEKLIWFRKSNLR